MPEIFADHPRLAKVTHSEGHVTVSFAIGPNGLPAELQIVAGHPWLQAAVEKPSQSGDSP
jgi:outer membrane biosynthesis protein TonB